ncbi:hypothetical protein ITP53_02840 [Nonomuraea sp. K274]|uniref:DUF5808 domain-containing protein n=1 Tax=Nonomuraea cypriaca TaxID=1187855 RepID=A0A931A1Y1_9ACTN|nr:hypothetical protein [Nonomuraea cypriaca]MBF8184696.1 hypothetical protein [Nonomuraea cypriaca]
MTMLVLACLGQVALLTVAAWALPVLTRPTLPFGVRVPAARMADPAITAQRRRYSRAVITLGVLAALASAAAVVLRGTPDVLTATAVLLGAADIALYAAAHHAVRAAKRRGNWYNGTRQAVTADTTWRTDPVRPPWPLLIPSLVVLAGTAAIGLWRYGGLPRTLPTLRGLSVDGADRVATTPATAFAPVLTQTAITLLVPLLLAAIVRARPETDAERPASSARHYRVYLRGITTLLLTGAACANLTLLLLALQQWDVLTPAPLTTVATWAPLAVAATACLVFGVRVGEAGHRLPSLPGESDSGYVQRDDDRYWHLAGTMYANRHDPAILIHQRIGSRWTLNLGNPVAWTVLAVVAALALLQLLGAIDLPSTG